MNGNRELLDALRFMTIIPVPSSDAAFAPDWLSRCAKYFPVVGIGVGLASAAVLLLAGMPAFIAETKFSGDAFRLFRWRSPETRMQIYLETVIAREDYAKEVKLYGLGPRLLERYRDIFRRLYQEDRALTIRRDAWGFGLGLIGTGALYGAYAWIAITTVRRLISLGQMTMYVALFRQGQATVSAMPVMMAGWLGVLITRLLIILSRMPSWCCCPREWRSRVCTVVSGVAPVPCLPRLSAKSWSYHSPRASSFFDQHAKTRIGFLTSVNRRWLTPAY